MTGDAVDHGVGGRETRRDLVVAALAQHDPDDTVDSLDDACLVLCELAEVLAVAERLDEAQAALAQALDRCRLGASNDGNLHSY